MSRNHREYQRRDYDRRDHYEDRRDDRRLDRRNYDDRDRRRDYDDRERRRDYDDRDRDRRSYDDRERRRDHEDRDRRSEKREESREKIDESRERTVSVAESIPHRPSIIERPKKPSKFDAEYAEITRFTADVAKLQEEELKQLSDLFNSFHDLETVNWDVLKWQMQLEAVQDTLKNDF